MCHDAPSNALKVTSALLELRLVQKELFPAPQSILAYEIFLNIVHHSMVGKPLTLIQLFHSVDFSETAVRGQLTKLINGGWCKLIGSSTDKRLKHVVAEPKLFELIDRYAQQMAEFFAEPLLNYKGSKSIT